MLGTVRVTVPESRRMVALYIAAGASFAALSARGLTVPLYAHDLGASRFEVGALFSVSTLAAALLSLPAGILVDRFGARALLSISFLLAAASQLATAATPSVLPLFAWQVVGGLAGGAQQAALFSAVTESASGSRLGRVMGWLTFSMQAGFFLGPSIAGIALRWIDVRTDIAVTTALLLFAIPGAIAASGTRQHAGQGMSFRAPLQTLLRQASFVPVSIGLIAASLVWGTIGAFLPVFGKEALGLPSAQVGYLLALQAVVNGVSRIPGGRLVDRARHRWPIVFVGVIGWSAASIVLGHLTGFVWPAIVLAAGLIGALGGRIAPRQFASGGAHAVGDAPHRPAVIDDDGRHTRRSARGSRNDCGRATSCSWLGTSERARPHSFAVRPGLWG